MTPSGAHEAAQKERPRREFLERYCIAQRSPGVSVSWGYHVETLQGAQGMPRSVKNAAHDLVAEASAIWDAIEADERKRKGSG